jgi:DNA (cytosine-5)-methyltransferase 1
MTHGSLFSGIGGFDLAAEWMGWENKFHCEWNPFGQKVLHHYFPNAEQFTDITKTDFTKYANKIDILTGGFPCQPYSSAGKRLGKEDERHLWPQMLRAIREIQPRWVVGENVFGLVNWSNGLVFHEVQTDLEAEGYEVQPYVLPAVSVNAPHRRDRIWFVAHSNGNGRGYLRGQKQKCTFETHSKHSNTCDVGSTTNTEYKTLEGQYREWEGCTEHRTDKGIFIGSENKLNAANSDGIGLWRQGDRTGESRFISKNEQRNYWQNFPTVSPICNRDDGISDRLDSITFPKWRNESIKAGGNAIVPQVVYQIFKAIEQYEIINEWI